MEKDYVDTNRKRLRRHIWKRLRGQKKSLEYSRRFSQISWRFTTLEDSRCKFLKIHGRSWKLYQISPSLLLYVHCFFVLFVWVLHYWCKTEGEECGNLVLWISMTPLSPLLSLSSLYFTFLMFHHFPCVYTYALQVLVSTRSCLYKILPIYKILPTQDLAFTRSCPSQDLAYTRSCTLQFLARSWPVFCI